MPSIHGNFAMHRIKTPDGKAALMLVEDGPQNAPWTYDAGLDDDREPEFISFEYVQGGEHMPDQYVTLTTANGDKIHFGPYTAKERVQ